MPNHLSQGETVHETEVEHKNDEANAICTTRVNMDSNDHRGDN